MEVLAERCRLADRVTGVVEGEHNGGRKPGRAERPSPRQTCCCRCCCNCSLAVIYAAFRGHKALPESALTPALPPWASGQGWGQGLAKCFV